MVTHALLKDEASKNEQHTDPRQLGALIFLHSCLSGDWVIVDLTREADSHNNYDIIGELPKHFPNISIISRNYLPLNIYDIDGRGYPTYTEKTKSNTEIMLYIKERLEGKRIVIRLCIM